MKKCKKNIICASAMVFALTGVAVSIVGKTQFATKADAYMHSDMTISDEIETTVSTSNLNGYSEVESYVFEENEQPDLSQLTDKEIVWHKMLNSVDYYNTVLGTTVYNVGKDITNCLVVNFKSNVQTGEAYTNVIQVKSVEPYTLLEKNSVPKSAQSSNVTLISDGIDIYELNNIDMTYYVDNNASVKRIYKYTIPDEKRYWINENNEPCFEYRQDVTNTGYAKRCIFSQELAMGYLHNFDLWTVDGIEECNNRKCYVISGSPDKDYAAKMNVENFVFYVDCETGILMKYEGYSENGKLARFLYTNNIKINEDIELNNIPKLSDYTETEYH